MSIDSTPSAVRSSFRVLTMTSGVLSRFRRSFTVVGDWARLTNVFADLGISNGDRRTSSLKQRRASSMLGRFLERVSVQRAILVLVVLCAVQMGIEANMSGEKWDLISAVCEQFFVSIFALEMVLRMIVDRSDYLKDGWNLLDCTIVCTSMAGLWIFPHIDENSNLSSTRIFRLLRLLRLGKVFHQFPELSAILSGLYRSMLSVGWALFILGLILYSVSILAVEFIGREESLFPGYSEDISAIEEAAGADAFNPFVYFGTLERSMLSLVGVVLLAEWSEIVRPVMEKKPWMILVFLALVVVATMGVLNIVIGIVVEKTDTAMKKQQKARDEENVQTKSAVVEELATLFCELDSDDDAQVSWQECFSASSEQIASIALTMEHLNFPPGVSLREIFKMLDGNGDGRLSKQEFIRGLYRIISCDQFQRDCIHLATLGQIISMQANLRKELQNGLYKLREELLTVFSPGSARDQPAAAGVSAPVGQVENVQFGEPLCEVQELEQSTETRQSAGRSRTHSGEDPMQSASAVDVALQEKLACIAHQIQLALVDLVQVIGCSNLVGEEDANQNGCSASEGSGVFMKTALVPKEAMQTPQAVQCIMKQLPGLMDPARGKRHGNQPFCKELFSL